MTGTAAKAALAEFVKDLERVEQLLDLMHDFRGFAATPDNPQESEFSVYASKLWAKAQGVRTDLPLLSGSLLLYLCGRFEYFVKELVESVVDELVDGVTRFDELPGSLRKEYLIRVLGINQSPGRFNHTVATAAALAAELATNLAGNTGSSGLQVDSSVITITESNMNSVTLAEIFKRVNLINLWDILGKQLPLRNYFGEATEAGCRKSAIARLDDIMSNRNKVAHPTKDTEFPDVENVQEVVQFFSVFSQVLVDFALVPR